MAGVLDLRWKIPSSKPYHTELQLWEWAQLLHNSYLLPLQLASSLGDLLPLQQSLGLGGQLNRMTVSD